MLTILNDPTGATGRRRIEWGAGTVFEQIARAMPEGGAGCGVLFNGVEIADPATDPRMFREPEACDEVAVVNRPEGVEVWVAIASLALAAYSYTLVPRPTDTPTASESPNNNLTGQSNIARAYQAVPDVYGRRRIWPDLIQPSATHYDAAGTKIITEWLCLSRGKGTLGAMSYADTPLADMELAGSPVQFFEPAASPSPYPELNDTTLTDVLVVSKAPEVNGQEFGTTTFASGIERSADVVFSSARDFTMTVDDGADLALLKSFAPSGAAIISLSQISFVEGGGLGFRDECSVLGYTVAGARVTFTLQARNFDWGVSALYDQTTIFAGEPGNAIGPFTLRMPCDGIRANVAFLRGLKGTVNIEATFWKVDAAGVEIGGTRGTANNNFTADTFNQRFFTWDITPSAGLGTYRVQFRRTTSDLGNGADIAKLDELYATRFYATQTLPGVTVAKVVSRATLQATGVRERKFNIFWTRHVRTLSSTSISASRNFARALVHLWAVAGKDVAEIDTTALAAINASLGEDSSLLRFDWSFDDANQSIGQRLQTIANVARCVLWRDGSKWTVTRDQARTVPEMQLDYRNLAADGDSSISIAAHLPASNDGVELEFVEEANQLTKDYVRLDITSGTPVAGTSANPKKVKLPGCATRDQALNRAQLEARKLLYQRTSVQDTALADAASLGPGSLVRWVDPNDFAGDDGLQAGEVLSISGSEIQTSEPLDWKGATTGRMLFTGVDGKHLGAPVVVTPIAGGAALASVPAGLYVRDSTRQLGSRYSFAVGLTDAEVQAAGLFLVVEPSPSGERNVGLSMVNYDDRCYAADTIRAIGTAIETDEARPILSNIRVLGVALETDSAVTLGRVLRTTLGIAAETDAAQPITHTP